MRGFSYRPLGSSCGAARPCGPEARRAPQSYPARRGFPGRLVGVGRHQSGRRLRACSKAGRRRWRHGRCSSAAQAEQLGAHGGVEEVGGAGAPEVIPAASSSACRTSKMAARSQRPGWVEGGWSRRWCAPRVRVRRSWAGWLRPWIPVFHRNDGGARWVRRALGQPFGAVDQRVHAAVPVAVSTAVAGVDHIARPGAEALIEGVAHVPGGFRSRRPTGPAVSLAFSVCAWLTSRSVAA